MKNTALRMILLLSSTIAGCTTPELTPTEQTITEQVAIYHLDESVDIICSLIQSKSLSSVLHDTSAPLTESYIKNFSPAMLAFEAEVLGQEGSVLLVIFDTVEQWQQLEPLYTKIAHAHPNIKIVTLNAQSLFSLTDQMEIEVVPACILIEQRHELGRVEGCPHDLEQQVEQMLSVLSR